MNNIIETKSFAFAVRIVKLEKGKIVEDGTYDELIALNGKFAELVERQRLDT